ncbi:hypothetical protein APA_498 [Pseudanabaena sp. lw0831]|nr:hypothetical protein APA_498 [Pseudanabaena sp. lw0831]
MLGTKQELLKKAFENYFLALKTLRDPPQTPLKRGIEGDLDNS